MKFKNTLGERSLRKWKEKQEWHTWFAWYPIKTCIFETTWLEKIERKWVVDRSFHFPSGSHWEYRKITAI